MSNHPPRVLCIDDDAELRCMLDEGLREAGFQVGLAEDGPAGIDRFLGEGADVVLLDLGMPGMDGVSVCRALKNVAGDSFVPIIFLTAQSDLATRVRVLGEGGDDFCSKPFALDELVARIRVHLRTREREERLHCEVGRFRELALVDPLTMIGNRRAFEGDLEREWARMERTGRSLALLIADIDRFKAFNDRYGHRTGDQVLRGVAQTIAHVIRKTDLAFRFGGEEFAVLLPETTHVGALAVAERIRRSVASQRIGNLSVTVSLGLAIAPDGAAPTRESFVESADQALYQAKAAGRDRVVSTWVSVPS